MRIYLLGYFGVGAFADDLIHLITRNLLLEAAGAKQLVFMDKQTFPHPTAGREVANFFNANTDLVIFCGGSLLGRLRLSPFNCIEEWIHHLNVPLVILGTGWRQEAMPLNKNEVRRMQLLLYKSRPVFVRGELSKRAIGAQVMPVEKVEALGDPGLAWPHSGLKVFQSDQRRVGVVVRQMSKIEIAQDSATIDNETFHANLAKLLDHITKEEDVQIVFFPMASQSRREDNDWQAVASVRLHMKTGDKAIIYDELFSRKLHSPSLVAELLGQMDFVVSQRLHGTLVSIAQGVPTMPIEYQFSKMEDALSVDGFERLRKLITPMQDISIDSYTEKATDLIAPDLLKENLEACKRIRQRYVEVTTSILRNACPECVPLVS